MALQLQNTYREPPRTQIHRVVGRDKFNARPRQNDEKGARINDRTTGPRRLCHPLGLPLFKPAPNTARTRSEQANNCVERRVQTRFSFDAEIVGKSKGGNRYELTRFPLPRQNILFRLLPRRLGRIQRPRIRLAVQNPRRPAIPGVE